MAKIGVEPGSHGQKGSVIVTLAGTDYYNKNIIRK